MLSCIFAHEKDEKHEHDLKPQRIFKNNGVLQFLLHFAHILIAIINILRFIFEMRWTFYWQLWPPFRDTSLPDFFVVLFVDKCEASLK